MTTNKRLAGWAASSADPAEVSMRVKGIILALSSVIIFGASNLFGIQLQAQDVVDLATQVSGVVGLTLTLYGAVLAFVRWVAQKRGSDE